MFGSGRSDDVDEMLTTAPPPQARMSSFTSQVSWNAASTLAAKILLHSFRPSSSGGISRV